LSKAIYPGSFDPATNGHMDIIERAARLFDEVVVAVARNVGKNPMFTVDERVEMLKDACSGMPNVTIDQFDGLLVKYAASQNARVIVRGLRAISDFELEFEMALMNRRLDTEAETVFLMTNAEYSYLSSSVVKEVAGFGGSVKGLVPEIVEEKLERKLSSRPNGITSSGNDPD
jgi:pantetheine-phosphate adenylyltransferase